MQLSSQGQIIDKETWKSFTLAKCRKWELRLNGLILSLVLQKASWVHTENWNKAYFSVAHHWVAERHSELEQARRGRLHYTASARNNFLLSRTFLSMQEKHFWFAKCEVNVLIKRDEKWKMFILEQLFCLYDLKIKQNAEQHFWPLEVADVTCQLSRALRSFTHRAWTPIHFQMPQDPVPKVWMWTG